MMFRVTANTLRTKNDSNEAQGFSSYRAVNTQFLLYKTQTANAT